MSTVAEFLAVSDAEPDTYAKEIAYMWDTFNKQRITKREEWKELRNYIFATDTSTTSNSTLPWKNKTTLPKLCQIRDNLHANYMSALFPNEEWLRWEAYSAEDAEVEKAEAIEGYMRNKTRVSDYRLQTSKSIYDYIDYGNCFSTVEFINDVVDMEDGTKKVNYIGPRKVRISPLDIVFPPTANSFEDTWKIVRSVKTVGELHNMAATQPDNSYLQEVLARRKRIFKQMGQHTIEDQDKAEGYAFDGFGNIRDYYQSGYVEILEFWGDYFDSKTGTLEKNKVITVVDRAIAIRNEEIPNWLGGIPIYHSGWRLRPDNLWAMGPLDNLVGMQYRIDHLENLKADAMDMSVFPPLKVIGEVEQFTWGPNVKIHIDEGGDVQELGKSFQGVISSNNEIGFLEQRMEQYAGAPSEAMGIRTAGEKTAFEVGQLANASGRIFQEKITHYEMTTLEKELNAMLEVSRRNMDTNDVIRVMDDDLGVEKFLAISPEDITAKGKVSPIGARHFAAQAQLVQNLTTLMNSPMAQQLAPHTSSIKMAKLMEDTLNLGRYELFSPNIAVLEQQDTQRVAGQAEEDLAVEQETIAQEGL